MAHQVRIVIVMGVSGSGKTTIGQLLAKDLDWPFYEGDAFHPRVNVEKMTQGVPLTDEDRTAWLTRLQDLIHQLLDRFESAVLACSALKQQYRDRLKGNCQEVAFVYLRASYDIAQERLLLRKGHFLKADLLASQFDTLEEPEGVLTVNSDRSPSAIVHEIKQGLGLLPI